VYGHGLEAIPRSSTSSHCSITRCTPASEQDGPEPFDDLPGRAGEDGGFELVARTPSSLRSTSASVRPKTARVIRVRRTRSGARPASRSDSSRPASELRELVRRYEDGVPLVGVAGGPG
jgi:hypothetical protein